MTSSNSTRPTVRTASSWRTTAARIAAVVMGSLLATLLALHYAPGDLLFALYEPLAARPSLPDYTNFVAGLAVSLCLGTFVLFSASLPSDAQADGERVGRTGSIPAAAMGCALLAFFFELGAFFWRGGLLGTEGPANMAQAAQTIRRDCPASPMAERIEAALRSPAHWEAEASALHEQLAHRDVKLGLDALELAAMAAPASQLPEVRERLARIAADCVLTRADRIAISRAIAEAGPEQLHLAYTAALAEALAGER